MNYIYELEMKVRDYECDLQGIVNNANYQHYLEHTRHEFLTSVGVSFAALHEQGHGSSDFFQTFFTVFFLDDIIVYGFDGAVDAV